jgi:GxxExxY protein
MDTDSRVDLQTRVSSKLLFKEETRQVIGCAFDVLNTLGHGLNEKLYENALTVEFRLRGIPVEQQKRFNVLYRDVLIGEFVPDLIAFGNVVVDAKVIEAIGDHERGQLMNYLRITKLRVGLILNFKYATLGWERVVV